MSVESERSVLGGLMLNNAAYDEIVELVAADDFAVDQHRRLFTLIAKHLESGDKIDPVILSDLHSDLDLGTLARMSMDVITVRNVPEYAKNVRSASVARKLTQIGTEIVKLAASDESLENKLDQAQAKLQSIAVSRTRGGPIDAKTAMSRFVDGLDTRFHAGGALVGIPTGYEDLDERTAGLEGGDLVIIAGRPSMGKTTFAMNIGNHVAASGDVLVFSLEMPTDQLMQRAVASQARVDFQQIRTGRVDDDAWPRITAASGRIANSGLLIDDTGGLKVSELRSRARRCKRTHDLKLIIVDYLQLVQGAGENRTQEVTQISGSLKAMAKELNVPVICLSQLNRGLTNRSDKRPTMSDLRESGSIEQDADLILLIYRDEVYHDDSPAKGIAEIIISKQRNGPIGTVQLAFLGQYARFENLARESWVFAERAQPKARAYTGGFDYNATENE